jgi:hypothetical protein
MELSMLYPSNNFLIAILKSNMVAEVVSTMMHMNTSSIITLLFITNNILMKILKVHANINVIKV